MRSMSFGLVTAMAIAPSLRAGVTVDVYAFDFDFSINPPDGPVEPAVIFAGDTIRWVFLHEMHNTVACVGQSEFWESDIFGPGDTFVFTFNNPGIFSYYCSPHGRDMGDGTFIGMGSTITVLPVPGPNAVAGMACAALVATRRRRR